VSLSRYLSPEPMLQKADFAKNAASIGLSPPTYAYGWNNPLRYADRNGKLACSTTYDCCVLRLGPEACGGTATVAITAAGLQLLEGMQCPGSGGSPSPRSQPWRPPLPQDPKTDPDNPNIPRENECQRLSRNVIADCEEGRSLAECQDQAAVCYDACVEGHPAYPVICNPGFRPD
jgi:hypothetical protein